MYPAVYTKLHLTKVDAILGPGYSEFETLISNLMSFSNDERSEAEYLFHLCKQNDPHTLSLKLINLLQRSTDKKTRPMSAILLGNLFVCSDPYIWPCVPQSGLRYMLLTCLTNEKDNSMAKKLCYTVSKLASATSFVDDYENENENEWPYLLPYLFQFIFSDSPTLQESGFLILSEVYQYLGESVGDIIEGTHNTIRYYLANSSNPDVRVAALRAAINSIKCNVSSDVMNRFKDLLPHMKKTLKQFLVGEPKSAQEALKLFIEFADEKPQFFKSQQHDVVEYMGGIVEAKGLEEDTKNLAVEFLISLEDKGEGDIRG